MPYGRIPFFSLRRRYGRGVTGEATDRAAIAGLIETFFAAFPSGPGCADRLDALAGLFLPQAVIVKTGGGEPTVYTVESFIAPRRDLLLGGGLTGFREWPTTGATQISGDIAQHFCDYAKEGVQAGIPFTGRGAKTLQLVRTAAGWRISAVAWSDEPADR
jgi:hypothetical protein